MPPRRNPNRPQTLKEARRAYLKRGGSSYMSNEERQRLIRAQEREEKRLEQVKKETARQEAAKKRAKDAAQKREERRRLGIPDPSVKLGAGQMRIGGFLKEKGAEELAKLGMKQNQAAGVHEALYSEQEMGDAKGLTTAPGEEPEHLLLPLDNCESEPEDANDSAALGAVPEDSALPTLSRSKPNIMVSLPDLRSSFFESNSQIEREVNDMVPTSPIERLLVGEAPLGQDDESAPTPKADSSQRICSEIEIKASEQAELENLLLAIPSQELDFLSSSPPSNPA